MSRLEVPKFKGPMSPSAIIQWLDRVSDSFDAFVTFNDDKKLTPALRILYAGLAMEEDTASAWWSENRTTLRSLEKWEDFTARVLVHFAPDGWKANMLRTYYFIQQQSRPYSIFVTELQTARSAIGTTGPLGITDRIHTNHLIFHAHNTLQRRVLAIPGFNLETITVDALTSLMSATWDSLVAEGVVRISIPTSLSTTLISPLPSMVTSRLPPLDDAEKKRISEASGCWKCRKTPASPGWTPHIGRTCPGDASLGILPGWDFVAVKSEPVATILSFGDDSDLQPSSFTNGEDQPDFLPDRFTVAYTEARVADDSSYRDGNNESDSDSEGY
ncbi:hypothetical protein DFH08DRAFT_805045 [Mycena albidolilacea]|uniref:Retrotransposon gag domain-containing protein n=1 Tax=Mycena albidolilacea TaxID=1033008 RepID=A0AAD7AAM8_9AGAR|nr:hypothetical protein DFH08DRAFT_805045 [Mycena albidolilacea]